MFYHQLDHFQDFYPTYGPKLRNLTIGACANQYRDWQFRNATCDANMVALQWNLDAVECSGYYLVDCIVGNLPETIKASMAGAGIVLGLMPVILSLVGSTTAELGLLALRRPLLAMLLGLGCPAVNPMRSRDYCHPLEVLQRQHKRIEARSIFRRPIVQALIEYVFGACAITNLVYVAIDLTRRTVIGNDINRHYQVAAWVCWAVTIHISGMIALRLRVRLSRTLDSKPGLQTRFWELFTKSDFLARFRDEITPCAAVTGGTISLKIHSWWFSILAWCVSLSTVVHIVWGSLIFSSVLFVSESEALLIVMRCMASVAVCRLILMHELSGLGDGMQVDTIEPEISVLPQHGAVEMVDVWCKTPMLASVNTVYLSKKGPGGRSRRCLP